MVILRSDCSTPTRVTTGRDRFCGQSGRVVGTSRRWLDAIPTAPWVPAGPLLLGESDSQLSSSLAPCFFVAEGRAWRVFVRLTWLRGTARWLGAPRRLWAIAVVARPIPVAAKSLWLNAQHAVRARRSVARGAAALVQLTVACWASVSTSSPPDRLSLPKRRHQAITVRKPLRITLPLADQKSALGCLSVRLVVVFTG
jgi:hypothetical protein